MKKRTSFALICVLLFSLLLTTSCNLFQPQIQSTTPESTPTEAPSDFTTPEATTKDELTNVPPVTLAGYEEVISLYQIAVEHLEVYYEEDPESSIYPEEIANADDAAKALYESIFLSAYAWYEYDFGVEYNNHGTEAYGYAIFDVNGNGTCELVLMTDECDILAIFSTVNEKATLLLDNREKKQYYFSSNGSIKNQYQKKVGDDYFYFSHTYEWESNDTLKDVGETKLFSGYISRQGLAQLTKKNTTFKFVRLMGPLTIQKPDIITWEWSNDPQPGLRSVELHIGAGSFTKNSFVFSLVYPNTFSSIVSNIVATREGDVAYFDTPEISGRIEFGCQSIWFIVEKSTLESVGSYAYLLTYVTYSKG